MTGVTPLEEQQQTQQQMQQTTGMRVIQSLMQQQQQKASPRQQKNICFGTAKTTGEENKVTLLAADVDLVASGVSKDCTNENLKEFLKNKGIDAVAVETLTKDEVLPNVRLLRSL